MATFRAVAFALSQASKAIHPEKIKQSQADQLIAAALGYSSLAAYQAAIRERREGPFEQIAYVLADRSKVDERAQTLRLPHEPDTVANLLDQAFRHAGPSVQLHWHVTPFRMALDIAAQDHVLQNASVRTAMAQLDLDDGDEVDLGRHFKVELNSLPPYGHPWVTTYGCIISESNDREGHLHGRTIYVQVRETVERIGAQCIAAPSHEVLDVAVADEDGPIRTVTRAQALANHLSLSVAEAEELVDVDPEVNASDEGLIYDLIFDFSRDASPAVAKKLRAKFGRLEVRLPPWVFDQVRPER